MADSKPPTVFYSWQSDLPNRTNRALIREALEGACQDLAADFEEVERGLVVDADTQGMSGSPDIAATILAKIEQAHVVVSDVSIIGVAVVSDSGDPPKTRPVPNPNVMLELGYAKKARGAHQVIMVCNTAFGKIEDLPFDIRGKSVMRYHYDGVAAPAGARNELRGKLKAALSGILRASPPAEDGADDDFEALRLYGAGVKAFEAWREKRTRDFGRTVPVPLATGPIAIVHLAAAASLDESVELDLSQSSQTILDEMLPLGAASASAASWAYREDSIALSADRPANAPVYGYTQLFSNGIIEYAAVVPREEDSRPNLSMLTSLAVLGLARISPAPGKLGLSGPFFIGLDLIGIGGRVVPKNSSDAFDRAFNRGRNIFRTSTMSLPLASTYVLDPDDADVHLREALHSVWRAAKHPSCPHYGKDGRRRRL